MSDSTTIPEGYKRCASCSAVLPANTDHFNRDVTVKCGLTSKCRECLKAYARAYYRANKSRWSGYAARRDKEDRSESQHQWYLKNRERILENRRQYRAEHSALLADRRRERRVQYGEQLRAKERAYYAANRDKIRSRAKVRYWSNPEHARAVSRRAATDWRIRHPDKEREKHTAWRRENPLVVRAQAHRRRARLRAAVGDYTAEDVRAIYAQQGGRCWWCGVSVGDDYHIDHRIPLVKGGSNDANNIVIACPSCNLSKGGKMPHEWIGRLL